MPTHKAILSEVNGDILMPYTSHERRKVISRGTGFLCMVFLGVIYI
jgi:hypothetical protein